jgi:hypothetical protein
VPDGKYQIGGPQVTLIEHGEPHEAHPAYWAPFVVVGEGGAVDGRKVLSPVPAKLKTVRKPRSEGKERWSADIWKQ